MNDVNMPEERKNGGGDAPRNFKTKYSLGTQKDISEIIPYREETEVGCRGSCAVP